MEGTTKEGGRERSTREKRERRSTKGKTEKWRKEYEVGWRGEK